MVTLRKKLFYLRKSHGRTLKPPSNRLSLSDKWYEFFQFCLYVMVVQGGDNEDLDYGDVDTYGACASVTGGPHVATADPEGGARVEGGK